MKKILSLLTSFILIGSTVTSVIGCDYKPLNYHYKWISSPLDLGDIDDIFSDILGWPTRALPKTSVIKKFINKNGSYPDKLSLDTFDFNITNFQTYITNNENNIKLSNIAPHFILNIIGSKKNDVRSYQPTKLIRYDLSDNTNISKHFYSWLNPVAAPEINNWNNAFKKQDILIKMSNIKPKGSLIGGIFFNQNVISNLVSSYNESYSKDKLNYTINDFTPDYGGFNNNINNLKSNSFIKKYLNSELNYWYYNNFSLPLEQTVPDYLLNFQKYKIAHDYLAKNLGNLLIFEFGGEYNSEIK